MHRSLRRLLPFASLAWVSYKLATRMSATADDKLVERYVASMVLSGVGDALGYRNGAWEFCKSGRSIHSELEKLGGIGKITLDAKSWRVSDDTVMHIATAEALVEQHMSQPMQNLYLMLARKYVDCMKDMSGRTPGGTCTSSVYKLKPEVPKGYQIPFNKWHCGCGGAMRSMCIGLLYPKAEDTDKLIAVSIEAGRMTHHHPVGYLGSLTSALFTQFAIQGKPIHEWGFELMSVGERALKYIEDEQRDVEESRKTWDLFFAPWRKYLEIRGIADGKSEPVGLWDETFDVGARDQFYKQFCLIPDRAWPGSCGHDAPLIAYDALLAAKDNWEELCLRGMLHGGDNDSTGAIAGAWFGALYGFKNVPQCNYEKLEKKEILEKLGRSLHELAQKHDSPPSEADSKSPGCDLPHSTAV